MWLHKKYGIIRSLSRTVNLYRQIMEGKLSLNEGMLYENAIAQMLSASNHKLYFYTHYNKEKKRNDIEVDFILTRGSRVNYKIHPRRYGEEDGTAYMPHLKTVPARL